MIYNIFKGKILYFEKISPEQNIIIQKLSACIWTKNIAGGSDIMYCQGK